MTLHAWKIWILISMLHVRDSVADKLPELRVRLETKWYSADLAEFRLKCHEQDKQWRRTTEGAFVRDLLIAFNGSDLVQRPDIRRQTSMYA